MANGVPKNELDSAYGEFGASLLGGPPHLAR